MVESATDRSHLDLALWCCTNIFNDSLEKNARKGIYILTCNDDILGDSFSGARADKKKETATDQCLQRVKDSVEKGILIDVWPLQDADSLVDDGPMPPAFKSSPFYQKL
jgi:hypothetical protein